MKKIIAFWLIGIVAIAATAVLTGCESAFVAPTTTTTTTLVVSATEASAAKAGVLVANGGSSVGTSASGVGSAAGAKIMSVQAFEGPPTSFFTSLMTGTASIDGYLPPTTESFGGNMTPYMRLKTAGGSVINAEFLTGKKIAKFLTLEVSDIMAAGEGNSPAGMNNEITNYVTRYRTAYTAGGNVHPFDSSTLFRTISTEADYMAWMFMFPTIEASVTQMSQALGGPRIYMATPEATASQKIGGMDMKMVFSKSITGEVVIAVSTDANGKPVVGTYSGSSTLSTPAGNLAATMSMTFSTAGPPSALKVVGTTETTPAYTVIVNMSPATLTATGEVRNSAGTTIGTLEGSASGGRVYIGSSSEAFSF